LTPIYKDYHFGGNYVEDLGPIFSTAAMKSELQTAKILWSPCDAEREAANEDATKGWSGYNAKTGNLISNSAISYVLIKGADTARPSAILSATRNLSTCDLARAKWSGADENPIPDHAMAGLNKSQGQIVLADGSAKQSTDADLGPSGKIVKGHINSSGGVTLGKASTHVIGCGGCGGGSGEFEFGFTHVFASHADKYLKSKTSAKKFRASANNRATYWGTAGDGKLALITQVFKFSGRTCKITLNTGFRLYNLGSAKGSASVWASVDGRNWVQLVDLPPPSRTSESSSQSIDLPSKLLGMNSIQIQVRMLTVNSPSSDYSLAQFSFDTEVSPGGASRGTSNVFEIKVKYN
jgi:hypothetical protein